MDVSASIRHIITGWAAKDKTARLQEDYVWACYDENMSMKPGNVIYQAYPRTFADGNGDGIGDFLGIEERIPYLHNELQVNGLWLSPFFESPWQDGGYDVSNYFAVNSGLHGSQSEAEAMITEANRHELDIIADFVPSHASDQHHAFQAALQDPHNTQFVFRPGKSDGETPNNWRSVFPQRQYNAVTNSWDMAPDSAWRLVGDHWPDAHADRLKQYCLTSFAEYQPNWNLANSTVIEHHMAAMRFWLGKGIKGFRVDAVDYMDHDRSYVDEPLNKYYNKDDPPYDQLRRLHSTRGPRVMEFLQKIITVIDEFPEAYMLLESYPDRDQPDDDPIKHYMKYYHTLGKQWPGRVAPFCFEITDLPWDAQRFKKAIDTFQAGLGPNDSAIYPGGNHDKPRLASRYGKDGARAMAVMQLTLPGVAVVYMGDELGMTNHTGIPREKLTDPYLNRDVTRSPLPMRGDNPRAGYSEADPSTFSLPIHPDYKIYNVQTQQADPESTWNLYRRCIALRQTTPAIHNGGYAPISTDPSSSFGFARTGPKRGEHMLTVMNFSNERRRIDLGDYSAIGQVLVSSAGTILEGTNYKATVELQPKEAVVIRPR